MIQDNRLSELQLDIMRVLWRMKEATVTDVHDALRSDRGLALTTIATVLSRLEKRGLLSHRSEGRQFVYRPMITEAEVQSSMVLDLADLLFEGDVTELVNHLLSRRDFSTEDISRVKSMIEAHEKEKGNTTDESR